MTGQPASGRDLYERAMRFVRHPGHNETGVDGLAVVCRTTRGERRSFVSAFASIILQGRKRTTVCGRTVIYGEGGCVVNCVNRPSETIIEEASPERPFLSLVLKLDPATIAGLSRQMPEGPAFDENAGAPVFVIDCPADIADAFSRMLALAEKPGGAALLDPLVRSELHARLLLSELGPWIRSLYGGTTRSGRLLKAVRVIEEHFREPIDMDSLAGESFMSPATFRRHFRSLTGCSPLQYQKSLRLFEVRRLLTAEAKTVSHAAGCTGYASVSQLSSDYRRFFGRTPREDALRFLHGR